MERSWSLMIGPPSQETVDLADRNSGFFSVVKRRTLTTLPSLLSDSINYLQKLKGTGDTVRKQVQAVDEPVKGLRERLAAEWKQVCREIQPHGLAVAVLEGV